MLNGFQQLGVFLAHDLVELRGLHPGLLHLLERPARINALVLAGVANNENAVIWIQLVEERPHLVAARKARLVEHIEMPADRIGTAPGFGCRRRDSPGVWSAEMPASLSWPAWPSTWAPCLRPCIACSASAAFTDCSQCVVVFPDAREAPVEPCTRSVAAEYLPRSQLRCPSLSRGRRST